MRNRSLEVSSRIPVTGFQSMRFVAVVSLLVLLPCFYAANAQDGQIVPADDPVYAYIERLQRRGFLLDLDPTTLPYRSDTIAEAIRTCDCDDRPSIRAILEYIDTRVRGRRTTKHPGASRSVRGGPVLSGDLGGSVNVINAGRLEILRPIGDAIVPYQTGIGSFGIAAGHWLARVGLRHDGYYDRDPDALDSANRLLIRSENAYIGYRSRYADAYLGRFATHWASRSTTALVISDNPRPYDAIHLRIGTDRYYLESIVGELDSSTQDGRFTGRVGDSQDPTGRRRFVSAHKFVWRPNRRFLIGIQESVLYSGSSSGLSLRYLNPVTALVFEVDSVPKNDENNGMIGGLLWFQFFNTTFTGQLILDDLDLRREGGRFEPSSVALSGSIVHATRNLPFDVGTALEVVTARTYSAAQPEGRYIYLLRGLATQFSDYVLSRAFVDLYLDQFVPGLQVQPSLTVLWQGEWDMRRDYPVNDIESILVGNVQKTVQPAVQVNYSPDPHLWLRTTVGYNHLSDAATSESTGRFVFRFSAGIRLALTGRG